MYRSVDVVIRSSIVTLLKKWNADKKFSVQKYDYQYLQFLLVECFGTVAIANGNLIEAKVEFVKNLFTVRVGNDQERLKHFDSMLKKKCDECLKNFNNRN